MFLRKSLPASNLRLRNRSRIHHMASVIFLSAIKHGLPHVHLFCMDKGGVLRGGIWEKLKSFFQYCQQQLYTPQRNFIEYASVPVDGCIKALEGLHSATGLPWWATISLFTLTIRPMLTLPLSIYQQKVIGNLAIVTKEFEKWKETLKYHMFLQAKIRKDSEEVFRKDLDAEANIKRKELIKKYNCHPLRALALPLSQIPVWLTVSLGLRSICGFPMLWLETRDASPGMTTEGLLWFADLTTPDPLMILPVATGIMTIVNIQMSIDEQHEQTLQKKAFTYVSRGMAFFLVAIGSYIPSGITLYWTLSAGYRILEHKIIRTQAVRTYFNIKTKLKK